MAPFGSVRGTTKVLFTGARAKVLEELLAGGTGEALSNIPVGPFHWERRKAVPETDVAVTTANSEQQ